MIEAAFIPSLADVVHEIIGAVLNTPEVNNGRLAIRCFPYLPKTLNGDKGVRLWIKSHTDYADG